MPTLSMSLMLFSENSIKFVLFQITSIWIKSVKLTWLTILRKVLREFISTDLI
jgi:hypothetical protein